MQLECIEHLLLKLRLFLTTHLQKDAIAFSYKPYRLCIIDLALLSLYFYIIKKRDNLKIKYHDRSTKISKLRKLAKIFRPI